MIPQKRKPIIHSTARHPCCPIQSCVRTRPWDTEQNPVPWSSNHPSDYSESLKCECTRYTRLSVSVERSWKGLSYHLGFQKGSGVVAWQTRICRKGRWGVWDCLLGSTRPSALLLESACSSWRRNDKAFQQLEPFKCSKVIWRPPDQHPKFSCFGDCVLRLEIAVGSWQRFLPVWLGMQVFCSRNWGWKPWGRLCFGKVTLWRTENLPFLPIRLNRSPFIHIHHILFQMQKPFHFRNLSICYLAPKQQTGA